MFPMPRTYVAAIIAGALLYAGPASGQPPRHQRRLVALQQQNAFLQQQNAVQVAVQQATAALQAANSASQQAGTPNTIILQQQQTVLQIAIQQTTALLQSSYRQNSGLGQLALRELNTLQGALQQTVSLQDALPSQGGKLTTYQVQLLSQVQTGLLGLLTSQLPPPSGARLRR